jgi:hypothetical protein
MHMQVGQLLEQVTTNLATTTGIKDQVEHNHSKLSSFCSVLHQLDANVVEAHSTIMDAIQSMWLALEKMSEMGLLMHEQMMQELRVVEQCLSCHVTPPPQPKHLPAPHYQPHHAVSPHPPPIEFISGSSAQAKVVRAHQQESSQHQRWVSHLGWTASTVVLIFHPQHLTCTLATPHTHITTLNPQGTGPQGPLSNMVAILNFDFAD